MLKLILIQENWGVLGAIFAFYIWFVVKVYLIDNVRLEDLREYVIVYAFSLIYEFISSIFNSVKC